MLHSSPHSGPVGSERFLELCARETAAAATIPVRNFLPLVENRQPVLAALSALGQDVFSSVLAAGSARVVEIGAGLGICRREFAPESQKHAWQPIEINPGLIAEASRRYGDTSIRFGNAYEKLAEPESLDAVVGLSSFDSISYLEKAFLQIRAALKPGGVFCHIQDVFPAQTPVYNYIEHRLGPRPIMLRQGCPMGLPVIVRTGPDGEELLDPHTDLRERMVEAIEKAGLTLEQSRTVAACAIVPRGERHQIVTGGVQHFGEATIITGRPREEVTFLYQVWNRGYRSSFDSFAEASGSIRDLLISHGADPASVGLRRPGLPRLGFLKGLMGRFADPQAAAEISAGPRAWLVENNNPLSILPADVLRKHGLVQEIALADIIVARKSE